MSNYESFDDNQATERDMGEHRFENDYENIVNQWETGRKSVQRGGSDLVRQQDLKGGDEGNPIRFAENRFHSCWLHMIQRNGKWKRLVCRGKRELLEDPNRRPALDPDNCPVCEWALEKDNKSAFPRQRFYFRVFDRNYQAQQKAAGLPDSIRIYEVGPQLFEGVSNVAMHPSYMKVVKDKDENPVLDPKTGKPMAKINLTGFDIILQRKKTGPQDIDVKYSVLAAGPAGHGEYTNAEKELILNSMPAIDKLVAPSTDAQINEALYDGHNEEQRSEESRVTRKTREDSDRVPFDND